MDVEYKLEDGAYALYWRGERLLVTNEVSVLIDLDTGSHLKHGIPAIVEERYRSLRKALQDGGLEKEAQDLVVITGKFELEDLNKMVSICGYAGLFYRNAMVAAACTDCDGSGMADSGGTLPWGETAEVPCRCSGAAGSQIGEHA